MRKQAQNEKLYLTIPEVCKRLGLCRESVETFLGRDLPVVIFGPRSHRVPVRALEHFESTRCQR
jgi:hypothetical protein